MNMKLREVLTVSLSKALEDWWEGGKIVTDEGFEEVPEIGENTYYLMAQSAVNVVMSNQDIEEFWNDLGILRRM